MLLHASPMYFYKKGKGRYRKAPPESLQAALASVERKQREAAQIAGMGRGTRRACTCRTTSRRSCRCCCTSRTRTRWNGRRWRRRATPRKTNPVDLAGRVRRDSVDARLPLQPLPDRSVSERRRISGLGRAAAAARTAAGGRACVLDRRCDDDGNRRCVLGARTVQRQHRDRHPHRVSGAGHAARAVRSTRIARERLSTVYMPGPQADDAAGGRGRRVHAAAGHDGAGAVAVRRDRRRRACRSRTPRA